MPIDSNKSENTELTACSSLLGYSIMDELREQHSRSLVDPHEQYLQKSIEHIWDQISADDLSKAFAELKKLRRKSNDDSRVMELYIFVGRCIGEWKDDGYSETVNWVRSASYSNYSIAVLTTILIPHLAQEDDIREYWEAISTSGSSSLEHLKKTYNSFSTLSWVEMIEDSSKHESHLTEAYVSYQLFGLALKRSEVDLDGAKKTIRIVKDRIKQLDPNSRDPLELQCWTHYTLFLGMLGYKPPNIIYQMLIAHPLVRIVREALFIEAKYLGLQDMPPRENSSIDEVNAELKRYGTLKYPDKELSEILVELLPGLLKFVLMVNEYDPDKSFLFYLFEHLNRTESRDHYLLASLSRLLLKYDSPEEAMVLVERSLLVRSDCPTCRNTLAGALIKTGNIGTARSISFSTYSASKLWLFAHEQGSDALKKQLNLPNNCPENLIKGQQKVAALSSYLIGLTYLATKEYDTAVNSLEESTSLAPAQIAIWKELLKAYEGKEDADGIQRCEEMISTLRLSTHKKTSTMLQAISEGFGYFG